MVGAGVLNTIEHADELMTDGVRWLLVLPVAVFLIGITMMIHNIKIRKEDKKIYQNGCWVIMISALPVFGTTVSGHGRAFRLRLSRSLPLNPTIRSAQPNCIRRPKHIRRLQRLQPDYQVTSLVFWTGTFRNRSPTRRSALRYLCAEQILSLLMA